MKREWEMVEGEKKGRGSREAKRSAISMLCLVAPFNQNWRIFAAKI